MDQNKNEIIIPLKYKEEGESDSQINQNLTENISIKKKIKKNSFKLKFIKLFKFIIV